MTNTKQEFRDPIHGFIYVDETEMSIIRTPIFQRLRNIKQLSLGHYVYHGAEHSRFGHVLGAMHLAGLAFDAMEKNSQKLGYQLTDAQEDRQALRIAALLHDVGHAPYSHSLENLLDDKHELYSIALVENYFADIIKKADIDLKTIKNLILGKLYPEKPYLSNIISGQLDVDRLDYLLRDSYYSGVSYGKFDLQRIMDQLAAVDKKFVVLHGGYEAVEQMIFARYQMYQQVYFHKTKRAFELMLQKCGDILKKEDRLSFPTLDDIKTEQGLKDFVERDDRWFLNIISDKDNPQNVLDISKRILMRQPYVETYSPLTIRKETSPRKTKQTNTFDDLNLLEDNAIKELASIKKSVLKEIGNLGIKKHEFLIDDLSRPSYLSMFSHDASDKPDYESDSIQIYYENQKLCEPIEKRSRIICTLAKNPPFMNRGFVIPEKYDAIREFLEKNHNCSLPQRNNNQQ